LVEISEKQEIITVPLLFLEVIHMYFNFRFELSKITPIIRNNKNARIYVFGIGENWDSICTLYKYLINIDLNEDIEGFIDNDINKQGLFFNGKPVFAFSEIDRSNCVILISAGAKWENQIAWQLVNAGFCLWHSFFLSWVFTEILMRWEHLRLKEFKNRYNNKRCFIVGNGPSLTSSDLDMLEGEISFASNKIFEIFGKSKWRPSYYVVSDGDFLEREYTRIENEIACPIFYLYNNITHIKNFKITNGYFFYVDLLGSGDKLDYKPSFSENIFKLQWGATVTYICLQIAVYMGFKKIYLLGIDNNYSVMVKDDGTLLINGDVEDYFNREYKNALFPHRCDTANDSYKVASKYAEEHGIQILNATRGGKLEVFERVDFDGIFRSTFAY